MTHSKRFVRIFAYVCAVLLVGALTLPIPVNIQCTGLEIDLRDENYQVTRQIHIEGLYYFNVFHDDRFRGRITVSGYQETENATYMEDILLQRKGSSLWYEGDGTQFDYSFGRLYSKKLFKNMAIVVYEHQGERADKSYFATDDARIIVVDAFDRMEAINQIDEYWYN